MPRATYRNPTTRSSIMETGRRISSGDSGRREVWVQIVTDFRCQRVVVVVIIDTDTTETWDLDGERFEKCAF